MDIQWTTSIQNGFPTLVETLQFETTELPGGIQRSNDNSSLQENHRISCRLLAFHTGYIYIYMGCVASGSDCICFFWDSTHSLASSSFTFFLCSSRHLGLPMPRTARLSKGPWWLTIPEAAFLLMVCESSYPVVATGRTIPLLKWIKEVFQPSQEITQISSMNSILGWGILGWKPCLDTHVSLCHWLSVLVRLR